MYLYVCICTYIYVYIYNAVTIFRWLFGFHTQPRAFFILYISVQTVSLGGACITVIASMRGVVNYLLENHASGQADIALSAQSNILRTCGGRA